MTSMIVEESSGSGSGVQKDERQNSARAFRFLDLCTLMWAHLSESQSVQFQVSTNDLPSVARKSREGLRRLGLRLFLMGNPTSLDGHLYAVH